MRIYIYIYVNLKVYILPPLNLNSYQCSCKQCCLYAVCVCYSLINPCGYWTWGTSFAFVSNRNTLYNVMGVKTHLSVNLPQSVSISGAEIKLTLWAVTTNVLCCNLAPSMSALKMCIFSNIVMKWQDFCCGFIGTYCVRCVVQQTSRVKDLSSLVRYNGSCLAAIRHVQSIIRIVRPRPNIRSYSALFFSKIT